MLRSRSLIRVVGICAVFCPLVAVLASEPTAAGASMATLIRAGADKLRQIDQALDELETLAIRSPEGAVRFSDRRMLEIGTNDIYGFSDLKRRSADLAQIANDIRTRTEGCDEDSRRIARQFRAQTQQLVSTINRLGFMRDSAIGPGAINQMRFAFRATEDALRQAAGLQACPPPDQPEKSAKDDKTQAE